MVHHDVTYAGGFSIYLGVFFVTRERRYLWHVKKDMHPLQLCFWNAAPTLMPLMSGRYVAECWWWPQCARADVTLTVCDCLWRFFDTLLLQWTPLQVACTEGHVSVTGLLLRSVVYINAIDHYRVRLLKSM